MTIEVVDAHTHIVSKDVARYPIVPGVPDEQAWHRECAVDVEELLALGTQHGVRHVAFVQSISCHGFDNRYVLDSAQQHPGRTVGIGTVRADQPGAVDTVRRDVLDHGMHGIRLFSVGGAKSPIDDPSVRAVVGAAGDLGLPVVLVGVAHQLTSVTSLVDAFPDVQFVIDHCFFADLSAHDALSSAPDLAALADYGNASLKVSSITLQSTSQPDALWQTLVARFGSARLLWGSDYPHTHDRSYSDLVELARRSTSGLAAADRAAVLAGTARTIWPQLV